MSTLSFLGAWHVTEYVYNPDGAFAGTIRQRRELVQLENDRIRVTQHCQPDAALTGGPMAAFSGAPMFELSVEGRYRRYHGPAVIGSGIAWSDGFMTASGIWPQFGHNFRSFAVLATPTRQLTGGKFFNATEMIANIVGVAAPAGDTDTYPTLTGTVFAGEIARAWRGRYRTIAAGGEPVESGSCERHYTDNGRWRDSMGRDNVVFYLGERSLCRRGSETLVGISKRTGWMIEAEFHGSSGQCLQIKEILDVGGGNLISQRRWSKDGQLAVLEVMILRP